MNNKIKVGILGAGRIGKMHIENISRRADAQVVAIADPMANEELKLWAKNIGIENVYTNADDVFSNKEIDAVVICSSTSTHPEFIIKAAQAGKHAFCEKPIGLEIDKIKEALEVVEKAGVNLQVGFVRRFDHNHKKVRDYVAEGAIGDPHIIKITSRDPEKPPMEYVKISGGIFIDMMIHDFDMARYLAGSEVVEVFAAGNVLIDPEFKKYNDVDTAMVVLKFENGALGYIDNSRQTNYGYDQRTEVFGSKGCAMVVNDTPNTASITTADGVYSEKPVWFFLERYSDAFAAEFNEFFSSIKNKTTPSVTGIDGLKPVEIAYAAALSLKENRPVKLSEIK